MRSFLFFTGVADRFGKRCVTRVYQHNPILGRLPTANRTPYSMNAKKTAAAFCMLAASVAVNAQTSDGLNELSAARKPHLEAGLRAGGYVSLERSGGFTDRNNLHGGLGGAFVRLRSGRQHRFGLELAAYHGATERSFAQVYDWMVMQPSSTTAGFRKRSTDIALQAQVHPGRDGQNVRPYAGVGIGATWNQYFSESKVLELMNAAANIMATPSVAHL